MELCSFWLWNFLHSFIFNWSIIALQWLSSHPPYHPYLVFFFWFTSLCMRGLSLQMTQFVPFHGWVMFHCAYAPHLLYPLIYPWTFSLLPCLAVIDSAIMNTGIDVSFKITFWGSFSIYILWDQFDFTIVLYMLLFLKSKYSRFINWVGFRCTAKWFSYICIYLYSFPLVGY